MNIAMIGSVILFIISLSLFAVTGDAFNSVMEDAADNSGLSGLGYWVINNFFAVLFGLGAIVMFATGLMAGGGD